MSDGVMSVAAELVQLYTLLWKDVHVGLSYVVFVSIMLGVSW